MQARRFKRKMQKLIFVTVLLTLFVYLKAKINLSNKSRKLSYVNIKNIKPINRNNYPVIKNFQKIDWHDSGFMHYEASRVGLGEQGSAVELTDPDDIKLNDEINEVEGLNGLISDKISVNRSLPDTRSEGCSNKTYLKELPKVSIVVIFFDEYQSILYRTLHSIYNRTPLQLIHEIIIVNDKSTRDYLYNPLKRYVDNTFHDLIKIINLKERSGLIRARMEGAKAATGEVLVFLDAHVEVNVNWLPPLLEPIAKNPLTVTIPLLDDILPNTFEYIDGGDGSRGVFDWNFIFNFLPKNSSYNPDEPSETPIMLGGLFAINRQYFWDLGAYDEELMIWNGENYELSFKLWLCGGSILEVPCSRVGHIFRNRFVYREKETQDFVARNFKRVAEVWLDEFKSILYGRNFQQFSKIDPGDLTNPKKIREQLKCKPFKYFLEVIAPDLLVKFPLYPDPDFAYGALISDANDDLCLDTMYKDIDEPIGIYKCDENRVNPVETQFFNFTWEKNIKNYKNELCLDGEIPGLFPCNDSFSGHFWKYNLNTQQLQTVLDNQTVCLTANLQTRSIDLLNCTQNDPFQKWSWGFKNETAIKNMK